MIRLTPDMSKQITRDWIVQFPAMGAHKSMFLARRVGPLVQGVCLDRSSGGTAYVPTTFAHCLCTESSFISLTLGQRLLTERSKAEDAIRVQFHENHVVEASARLKRASLLPLDGNLTFNQVLHAYRQYRELRNVDSQFPIFLFRDAVLLAAFLKKYDVATRLLELYCEEVVTWPAQIVTRIGGVDQWHRGLSAACEDRDAIVQTVESEIVKHKLSKLPTAELLA